MMFAGPCKGANDPGTPVRHLGDLGMRHSVRAAAILAALLLVTAACTSAGASPSAPPAATPAATPTAAPTDTPTAEPTAEPTAPATPAPTPVPASAAPTLVPMLPGIKASLVVGPILSIAHGVNLLYDGSKAGTGGADQPQLWLIKPDGTGAKLIASGYMDGPYSPNRFNIDGVFSHNGQVLHILRYPACIPHLVDMPSLGGAETAKVTLTTHDGYFLWSPDDKKIVYRHYHEDEICEQNGLSMINDLVIMNADGSGKKTIRVDIPYQVTAWLPDGSGLLAVNPSNVWMKVSLTDGVFTSIGIVADRADVSPDGTQIAYLKAGHLWVRKMSGGASQDFGAAQSWAWAPTTPTLAIFTATNMTVRSSNTGVGQIVYSGSGSSLTWSPDGKKIAFRKSTGGLFVIPADGATITAMPGTSHAGMVDWQP